MSHLCNDSVLGCNDKSWSLRFCNGKYTAWYNKNDEAISVPYFITKRVGVYLDWPAGTLSFYAVSSNSMTHLHTLHAKFTEPLYPGFRLGFADTSLSLMNTGLTSVGKGVVVPEDLVKFC
uniref:B30.2/SPRY domain-containing protein n=1 Tax=Myripristis murdjan TaxID=586833 RepID=A0A667X7I8_9TELE